MHPSKYEILLKVAETESFTKTAEYYKYTQSAISQMVKSVEENYKITLFQRTKTGLKITEEGKILLPHIRMIVEGQRNLADQVNEIHHLQMGVVKIGAYLSLSMNLIPRCIKLFLEDYPHVRFELIQEDDVTLYEKVRDGDLDIAFMSDPRKRDTEYEGLFVDPFQLCLPADHPLADRQEIDLQEVKEESFIFLNVGYASYLDKMFKASGYKPHVRYEMIDDLSTLAMVDEGLGISIMPKFTTNNHPYHIAMVDIKNPISRVLGAVTRKNSFQSWAAKAFLDYVRENLPEGYERCPAAKR